MNTTIHNDRFLLLRATKLGFAGELVERGELGERCRTILKPFDSQNENLGETKFSNFNSMDRRSDYWKAGGQYFTLVLFI